MLKPLIHTLIRVDQLGRQQLKYITILRMLCITRGNDGEREPLGLRNGSDVVPEMLIHRTENVLPSTNA
ncbi:unnamed protein product [Arabis nemorensis]|uniref:Uncharacterized protein n=1 Tax=Arabis nemorensis TaxID=586526 RepID=A0A565BJJ8_9BRAS|nr:unnamed protein product [Arabis nemorensis]